MARNFVLFHLGDNDYSEDLKLALEQAQDNLDLSTITEARLKDYAISCMVATNIIKHADINPNINWNDAKRTEEYLTKNLKVSFPIKVEISSVYDSGAAYLDINLCEAFILSNALANS